MEEGIISLMRSKRVEGGDSAVCSPPSSAAGISAMSENVMPANDLRTKNVLWGEEVRVRPIIGVPRRCPVDLVSSS